MLLIYELIFLLVILPGVALAYAGFYIHRRHMMFIGFVIGAITGGLFAAIIGDNVIILLILAIFSGLAGAKMALAAEKSLIVFGGFLVTAFLASIAFKISLAHPIPLLFGIIGAVIAWRAHVFFILFYTAGVGTVWMYIVIMLFSDYDILVLLYTTDRLWLPVFWVVITSFMLQTILIEEGYLPHPETYVSGETREFIDFERIIDQYFRNFPPNSKTWKDILSDFPSERPLTTIFLIGAAIGFWEYISLFAALFFGTLFSFSGSLIVFLLKPDHMIELGSSIDDIDETNALKNSIVTIMFSNPIILFFAPFLSTRQNIFYSFGIIVGLAFCVFISSTFIFIFLLGEANLTLTE